MSSDHIEMYKMLFEGRMPFGAFTAIHIAMQEAYSAWPSREMSGVDNEEHADMLALALCKIVAREYNGRQHGND